MFRTALALVCFAASLPLIAAPPDADKSAGALLDLKTAVGGKPVRSRKARYRLNAVIWHALRLLSTP